MLLVLLPQSKQDVQGLKSQVLQKAHQRAYLTRVEGALTFLISISFCSALQKSLHEINEPQGSTNLQHAPKTSAAPKAAAA